MIVYIVERFLFRLHHIHTFEQKNRSRIGLEIDAAHNQIDAVVLSATVRVFVVVKNSGLDNS